MIIKVSAQSNPSKVARAIAMTLRREIIESQFGYSENSVVQSIGVKALNKAVKAIAQASSYLTSDRISLTVRIQEVLLDLDHPGEVQNKTQLQGMKFTLIASRPKEVPESFKRYDKEEFSKLISEVDISTPERLAQFYAVLSDASD